MSICCYENHMVLNPGKCHYLVLRKRSNSNTVNLNGTKLASSGYEKLLGIFIDRDLHTIKKRLLLNSVIQSQFRYCPLTWMFCSRPLNNLINPIHERALRLIYNDHVSSFRDILEMTKEKTIHQNNLESFAKETY